MLPTNKTRGWLYHTEKQRLSNTDKNEGFKTKSSHEISFLIISDYKSCTHSDVKVKGLKEKYCLQNSKPAI